MNWENIEKIVGETLPMCIKRILSSCGYDTFSSLKFISENSLNEIENHMNTRARATLEALNCCHAEYYKSIGEFKLIPGHRNLIMSLSKLNYVSNEQNHSVYDSPKWSCILTELLNAANNAANNFDQQCSQYSDRLRYFATYIFLLGGRSCYEVLNHNLPFPSTKTVCMFNLYRIVNFLCIYYNSCMNSCF